MADSVVKLRVDSKEYDSKLKRAAEGVRAFGDNCRKAGESVSKADKETLSYVQAIGKMDTVSKTAKGRINEMTSAFTDLSVQYKRLTDEEKASPFGQAMSQSLEQLKGRINENKAQLAEVNAELGNTSTKGGEAGGVINQLAGKFSITLDAVKLFNVGLQATQAALQVAKDAFFASEAAVDEWGRIVDSSKSLYEGFLNSINNGDISGFLGNMREIVAAAKEAYNELDRVYTMKTIQAPQISAQQTENDRIRQMIQTGIYIAPNDGRKPTPGMTNGQTLTPAQIRRLEQQLTNGMNNVVKLVGNEVQQTGKAIEAIYRRQGAELGMSVQEFKKGTSSMAEFDKRMAGYEAYKKWDAEAKARFAQQGGRGFVDFDKSNPYAQYRRWGNFRVDGDRYNDLVRLIQQRDQQAAQSYSVQGQAYRTINRAEGITTRSIMGGGGGLTGSKGGRGGGGGTIVAPPPVGSIAEQEAKVQALTKAWREASDEAGRSGYLAQLNEAKAVLDEMQGKKKDIVPEGSFKALNQELRDLQAQRELLSDPMEVAILDDQINEVREKIDELNGKTVKVSVEVPKPPTLEFQIRTKMAEDAIAADANALKNLLEVTIKNEIGDITLPPDTLERMFAGLDVPGDFLERIIRDGLSGVDILGGLISGKYGEVMNVPDDVWQGIVDQINEKLKEKGLGTISLDTESGNVSSGRENGKTSGIIELTGKIGRLTDSIGSITTGLEQLGIKIPDGLNTTLGVIQSLITVIHGVQSVISVFSTTSQTANTVAVTANTAALAALTTAMATNTISNFIPFFASGGVAHAAGGLLTGNRFSGDNVPVMVNDGELILNRAQQGVVANELRNGTETLQLEARIHGEDILLSTRNVNRRRGKSEMVGK